MYKKREPKEDSNSVWKHPTEFISGKGARFLLLMLILLGFVGIQVSRLSAVPWDQFGSWRQSDTYSIAVNYYKISMNFLQPQLNYDGLSGNYAQLELQIVPYLSAILFHFFNTTSWVIPRAISLLFFVGSAIFLFLLNRQFTRFFSALAGLVCYLSLPLSVMMAAAIQPEACVLFFFCGATFFLKRYQDTVETKYLIAAAVMCAFGIMEKTPFVFIGFLFLYVILSVHGKKMLTMPLTYVTGVIALLPPILHLLYSSRHSVFRFVDGIATKHVLTSQIFSIFTRKCIIFFYDAARDMFGWPVVFLAVTGFILCVCSKQRFLFVWVIAFALEAATIVAVIQFNYYLVFLLPICGTLCSITVEELCHCRKAVPIMLCVGALMFALLQDSTIWLTTNADSSIDRVGRFISENVEPDEGVAIAVLNPAYLNAADRMGYRANIQYYDYIPVGVEEEIKYYIEQGVRKFIVVDNWVYNDIDGSYRRYLEEHFPVCAQCDYCTIYNLTEKNT